MSIRSQRLLPLLAFLAIVSTSCPEQGRNDAFFFMVFADPQFGITSGGAEWVQEEINLGKAVDAANRLRPAFVVVCGDLTHLTGDSAAIDAYTRAIRRLDAAIPLYELPGNHDVGNIPTDASLAAYRAVFGKDYYAFRNGFVHGIVLNAPLIKDSTLVREERERQDAWLRRELETIRRHPGRHAIVFQHQPWFVDSLHEADGYENLPQSTRERYLKSFADAGVSHVFSGHLHRNARSTYEGVTMITTGPVSMQLGNDPTGVRIVFVDHDSLKDVYYPLNEIPEDLKPAR